MTLKDDEFLTPFFGALGSKGEDGKQWKGINDRIFAGAPGVARAFGNQIFALHNFSVSCSFIISTVRWTFSYHG